MKTQLSDFSHLSFVIFLVLTLISCKEHVDYPELDQITIYRDDFGVPHIVAPTDEEVAYGLAWAQCEDDFVTLQEQMLAAKGMLGQLKGKDGVVADFAIKFMGLKEFAEQHYKEQLSPKVIKVMDGFLAGVNSYANQHPEEVLIKEAWPTTRIDLLVGSLLGLVEISGAGTDLRKIMDGKIIHEMKTNFPKGSNAIAISSNKTKEKETFLAINSHQPLEGWYSWYEAHLISDEGLNILGGTFPGGMSVFHGVNENLGWAHTVNHADFSDVYKLKMHPDNALQYQVDGEWLTLEKKTFWAWVRVAGPIKVPVKQTMYKSIYGNTFKTDEGVFAWRFIAGESIAAQEQWYRMNKAQNFEEFKAALEIQGMPCTNIVYADREDNIYYLSNAKVPNRNPKFKWSEVLPGDTKETLWGEGFLEIDDMVHVLNPTSGFVFNTNNSPYSATAPEDNYPFSDRNHTINYQIPIEENNRSLRFLELMSQYDSLSYADFKAIKYDVQYPKNLRQPHLLNLEDMLHLDPKKYPDIKKEINLLASWNRRADKENKTTALFLLSLDHLNKLLREQNAYRRSGTATEDQFVEAIKRAQTTLVSSFDSVEIELGKIMRHTRGDVDIPLSGGSDVLAAVYGSPRGDGTFRATGGESYIELVRFSKDGLPQIESINAYGSSAESDSPHYTDQMQMYADKKLKKMSISREYIEQNYKTKYHPR